MSTPIDPNAPTFEQKALKAIHEDDRQGYANLFGGKGYGTLRKAMEYVKVLEKRGLVHGQKEGGDVKIYLTDKGKAEIGV